MALSVINKPSHFTFASKCLWKSKLASIFTDLFTIPLFTFFHDKTATFTSALGFFSQFLIIRGPVVFISWHPSMFKSPWWVTLSSAIWKSKYSTVYIVNKWWRDRTERESKERRIWANPYKGLREWLLYAVGRKEVGRQGKMGWKEVLQVGATDNRSYTVILRGKKQSEFYTDLNLTITSGTVGCSNCFSLHAVIKAFSIAVALIFYCSCRSVAFKRCLFWHLAYPCSGLAFLVVSLSFLQPSETLNTLSLWRVMPWSRIKAVWKVTGYPGTNHLWDSQKLVGSFFNCRIKEVHCIIYHLERMIYFQKDRCFKVSYVQMSKF